MNALAFWTAADPKVITRVIGRSLQSFRPNVPAHRFIEYGENKPMPEPAAGEVVVVCGDRCLDVLRRAGVVAKNPTVNSMREVAIKRGDGWYLVSYDPSITDREPEKTEIIDWDVRLAHRLHSTGSLQPKLGDYQWVSSFAPMIAEIEAMYEKTGKPVKVAFDTETMGLYPWHADKDIVVISFTHKPGCSRLMYFGPKDAPVPLDHSAPLFEQIKWLLTSPKVRLRMANGKYDMIWVKEKWGLDCSNFTFDTLLVGSLLNENRTNSLNLHAKLYSDFGGYDDEFNRTEDKGHMEAIPPEKLLSYAGGDTDACYQAAEVLAAELGEDPALTQFYQVILHPAARAFEKVERRGILIDQEKYTTLAKDLRVFINERQQVLLGLLPGKMKIKYRDRIEEQLARGKNPLLPSILHELFFTPSGFNLKPQLLTEKTKEPSLTKPHLRAVAASHPAASVFIAAMTEADSAAKTLSTFVEGFLKHLRPDGRFHPSYMLFHGGFGDDDDDESGTVCVTADTLFFTDRGQIPFSEVRIGDHVISHTGQPRRVTHLVDNGVKPVYRVELAGGMQLSAPKTILSGSALIGCALTLCRSVKRLTCCPTRRFGCRSRTGRYSSPAGAGFGRRRARFSSNTERVAGGILKSAFSATAHRSADRTVAIFRCIGWWPTHSSPTPTACRKCAT
jgi:hypothetical protein